MMVNIVLDSCGNFYYHFNGKKSADVFLHCKFLKENEVLEKYLRAVHILDRQNNASKPHKTLRSTKNLNVCYYDDSRSTNAKFFPSGVSAANTLLVISITSFYMHGYMIDIGGL